VKKINTDGILPYLSSHERQKQLLKGINKVTWSSKLHHVSAVGPGKVYGHCGCLWPTEHTAWPAATT